MEEVGSETIKIEDTEAAKRTYKKISDYLFDKTMKDKEIISTSHDIFNYTQDEYIFQCMNSAVRAQLNHPNHNYRGKPDIRELILDIFGEKEARESTKKRLEEITGEKFN